MQKTTFIYLWDVRDLLHKDIEVSGKKGLPHEAKMDTDGKCYISCQWEAFEVDGWGHSTLIIKIIYCPVIVKMSNIAHTYLTSMLEEGPPAEKLASASVCPTWSYKLYPTIFFHYIPKHAVRMRALPHCYVCEHLNKMDVFLHSNRQWNKLG